MLDKLLKLINFIEVENGKVLISIDKFIKFLLLFLIGASFFTFFFVFYYKSKVDSLEKYSYVMFVETMLLWDARNLEDTAETRLLRDLELCNVYFRKIELEPKELQACLKIKEHIKKLN